MPRPGCVRAARIALQNRPDDFFTSFALSDQTLAMPLGGDTASQYLGARAYGPECIALTQFRRKTLGPLEPYDLRHGLIHEYVTRNVTAGADLLVFPEPMMDWPDLFEMDQVFRQDGLHGYLRAKPLIDTAGLPLRKVLLAGLSGQSGGGGVAEKSLRDGGRSDTEPVWMMPVEWTREDIREAGRHRMAIGLDEKENTLWLLARGPGERAFLVGNTPQKVTEVDRSETADGGEMTISTFQIPDVWEVGQSYAVRWELDESAEGLRTRFLRISKLGANTYAISARKPVLSKPAFERLIDRHKEADSTSRALDDIDLSGIDDGDLTSLSPETLAVMSEAGVRTVRTSDGAPKFRRPKGGVEAMAVDDLLALAYDTGRSGLERKLAHKKSGELLQDLPQTQPDAALDLRTGLVTQSDGAWPADGWIEGWAWDRAAPDKTLTILVRRGTEPVFATRTDVRIDRLASRTPGLEDHGFRLPLSADLFGDDPDATIDLVVAETGTLVRGGNLRLSDGMVQPVSGASEDTAGALAQSESILGTLGADPATWPLATGGTIRAGVVAPQTMFRPEGGWIEGWAWDKAAPQKTLTVAILQDGQAIFATSAATHIPSLGIRTPGLEAHGFRVPILARMTTDPIELRVVETGDSVRNGTFEPSVGADGRPGLTLVTRG